MKTEELAPREEAGIVGVQPHLRRPILRKPRSRFDSQTLRGYVQAIVFFITCAIGVQFYLFVRYYEHGRTGWFLPRPPGVEGFLPISALISLRYTWLTGRLQWIHPAGLVLLVLIVLVSLLFKKAFCSYICPVGFASESLAALGRKLIKRRLLLPRFLDYPLRGIKYLLLMLFIYAVFVAMSPRAIELFVNSPYNQAADIKMLKFFTEPSATTVVVLLGLLAVSVLYEGFWCRYLCPYGALLGFASLLSPLKVRRNRATCIDCLKCSKVCPGRIQVHRLKTVHSDECSGCLACVEACPVKDTLEVKLLGRTTVKPKLFAAGLVLAFFVPILGFKLAGYWQNRLTFEQYRTHIENIHSPIYYHNRGQVSPAPSP